MHRAAVLLRTVLLAALMGLLCVAPAAAARPSSHAAVERHGTGWSGSGTHGTAEVRAVTTPTAHRAGPRVQDALATGLAAAVPATGPAAPDRSVFVGHVGATYDAPAPRALSCPKMRAPPT